MATGCYDDKLRVVNARTGQVEHVVAHGGTVPAALQDLARAGVFDSFDRTTVDRCCFGFVEELSVFFTLEPCAASSGVGAWCDEKGLRKAVAAPAWFRFYNGTADSDALRLTAEIEPTPHCVFTREKGSALLFHGEVCVAHR